MKDIRVIEIIDPNLCRTCPFAGRAWHKLPGEKTGGWILRCHRLWCDNWDLGGKHRESEYLVSERIIAQIDSSGDE